MNHLLVSNDFPPKVGGIQSYLWELWRRLPPERFAVITTDHPGAAAFDDATPFRIERLGRRVLLPSPEVVATTRRLAAEIRAGMVVVDPVLPLGLVGTRLGLPYALVLHGAEVTVPARVPALRGLLRGVLASASLLIAAGEYPLGEATLALPSPPRSLVLPPGVDTERFRPLDPAARAEGRRRLGLPDAALLVTSVSRLVPRKGMDVLIESLAALGGEFPALLGVIAGSGRDAPRLAALARRTRAPVRFLGRVSEEELPELYGVSDVFAMLCRTRWLGLEQEGFGIVFNEAAAAGVPSLAGDSG